MERNIWENKKNIIIIFFVSKGILYEKIAALFSTSFKNITVPGKF
jgi:hypothetical protein